MLGLLFVMLTVFCTTIFIAAIIVTGWSFLQAVKFFIRGN